MLININSISATAASRLNMIFVVCKLLTIFTVIIGGLVRIGQGLLLLSRLRNKQGHLTIICFIGYTQNLQNSFAGRV
jgi:hypothetical protein